jgi:hypothetical protein
LHIVFGDKRKSALGVGGVCGGGSFR